MLIAAPESSLQRPEISSVFAPKEQHICCRKDWHFRAKGALIMAPGRGPMAPVSLLASAGLLVVRRPAAFANLRRDR